MLVDKNIKLGKGIGQIRFGMSKEQVEEILGQPMEVDEYEREEGNKAITIHYDEANLSFTFDEVDDFKLGSISANSTKYVLQEDIMIGMEKQKLLDILDMLNMTDYANEDMSNLDNPNYEVVTIDRRSVNFWFDSEKLTEIQWWPLIDEDENYIWPEIDS